MFRQLLLSFQITWQNFLSAKLRTSLTILGIVVGIASVLIVMSVGSSVQNVIVGQVRNFGSNLVAILPGAAPENGPPAGALGVTITTLTNGDLEALRKKNNAPHIEHASGYVSGSEVVNYRSYSKSHTFQGVSSDLPYIENITLSKGRFFTVSNDESHAQVVVLGATVADDIFDQENPVGKKIKIGEHHFTVIGVLKKRGSTLGRNNDDAIYMPLLTAQNNMLGINYLNLIRLSVDDEKNMEQTKKDIDLLLRLRHNIEDDEEGDYSVRDIASALKILNNITDVLKFFLVAVSAIALLIGGIGVMNIMFIALSQRIKEIGLRKSVGARNKDIASQFLFESMLIALAGGVIGFILGSVVIWVIALVARSQGYQWQVFFSWEMVVTALVTSLVLGFLFGAYPAKKAAKISPMDALRYE